MSTKILFIGVKDVKERSIIDGSVDPDKVIQFIEMAQDKHIQNYLGTALYEALMAMIDDGSIQDAANSNYKQLLIKHIKPMLVWYTQTDYLPFSAFTVSNGGVYKHSSENSETISEDELNYLIAKCKENATFYTDRFIDYICDNSSLFPEYNTNQRDGMYPDKDANYGTGWVI